VTDTTSRRLRADAARNSQRIIRAAREVYADEGPDALLDEVARRAGVGRATLFRRFPNKEELMRAAIDQIVAEQITPAIERALGDDNPRSGLTTLFETVLSLVAREHNLVAAARACGAVTPDATAPFRQAMAQLTQRAQQAGLIRADLVPNDVLRIVAMLIGVLSTMNPASEGWRRYLALVLDALSPAAAHPLPPAEPLLADQPGRGPI
jgi:AcrR family transcriptional regulator